ncbi:MAG TPA: S1C family serine protease [Solirubrobacteraceae bacterium]|nr:S1C family serine protease [Solirubrobacteraceae bacterium]
MTLLEEMETAIGDAARTSGPAVVGIERRAGRGTGIVTAPGEVLTLASNLRDPTAAVGVAFAGDAPNATGTVAGIDGVLDLALLRVPTGDVEPLAFVPRALGVGAAVIALANPGGQGLRATLGFVAADDRSFRGPRGRVVDRAIEHTAPLPRGAGGGPLLDAAGRLVGLNAVRVQGGLILALPGAAVAERLGVLGRADAAEPRQLGVAIVAPRVARRLRRAVGLPDRDGLLIQEVAAGSAAARAQIREGDLIVAADDQPVDGVDGLYAALDRVPAAGTVALRIVRGVEELELAVAFDGDDR